MFPIPDSLESKAEPNVELVLFLREGMCLALHPPAWAWLMLPLLGGVKVVRLVYAPEENGGWGWGKD